MTMMMMMIMTMIVPTSNQPTTHYVFPFIGPMQKGWLCGWVVCIIAIIIVVGYFMFSFKQNKNPTYVEFFFIKKHINANGNDNDVTIINTLSLNEQDTLITKTLPAEKEVMLIQSFQDNFQFNKRIIIYGKNCIDTTVETKFHQLSNLGFTNVSIYKGGMFEWALLQDIYGKTEFPTTTRILDPLKWCDSSDSVNDNRTITATNGWNSLLTYLP